MVHFRALRSRRPGSWLAATLALLFTATGCSRPPKPTWTVALPEESRGTQPLLSKDWVILPGLRQILRWRRSDGQMAPAWPEAGAGYYEGIAALPQHAALRASEKISILDLASGQGVFEADADAGPYSDGQRFYWSHLGAAFVWDPAQGHQDLAALGGGLKLEGIASGEGVTLLSVRRLSGIQVTLNKGLVVSGYALALDSQGRELWRYEHLPQGAPLISGGSAYFADHDVLAKQLHAVSLTDGKLRWKRAYGNAPSDAFKAKSRAFQVPETPKLSPPFMAEGLVILAVTDGDGPRLLALDPANGEERWVWAPLSDVVSGVGDQGPAFSFPAWAGGSVLLGVGARVQALASDGGKAWAFKASGPIYKAPVADQDGWAVADPSQLYSFKTSNR